MTGRESIATPWPWPASDEHLAGLLLLATRYLLIASDGSVLKAE
jgi:hypothetical protein